MSISHTFLSSTFPPRPHNFPHTQSNKDSVFKIRAFTNGRTLKLPNGASQVRKLEPISDSTCLGLFGGVKGVRKLGFCVKAVESEGGGAGVDDELRGESTMPERFRPLTKEVPDPPVRWPWFVGNAFF